MTEQMTYAELDRTMKEARAMRSAYIRQFFSNLFKPEATGSLTGTNLSANQASA